MSQKSLSELQQEIDAAINPNGGVPLTTGPHLNAVLTSLAAEVVEAGAPFHIIDFNQVLLDVEQAGQNRSAGASYSFADGDLITLSGLSLYQCLQGFTLSYNFEDEEVAGIHWPATDQVFWKLLLRNDFDTFVSHQDLNYKVARWGQGPNTAIVASPNLPATSTAWGSVVVGGEKNSVSAIRGAVVGGYNLQLPDKAENSVLLGGQNYTAPAEADTVFVPRLAVWQPGAGVLLTDEQGGRHRLAAKAPGILTFNDSQVSGTPFVAYIANSGGFVEANPQTHSVPITGFTLFQQPSSLPFYELKDGALLVPASGLYEITVHARLGRGALPAEGIFGVSGGPFINAQTMTWTQGASGPNSSEYPTSAYNAQCMGLDVGQPVYVFAQFDGMAANPKVDCQLTVRLLNVL